MLYVKKKFFLFFYNKNEEYRILKVAEMLEYNKYVLLPTSYKMHDDIYFIIMRLTRDQFDEEEKIGTRHIKCVGLLAMFF